MHKTIHNEGFSVQKEDHDFTYQSELTKKLDAVTGWFDQNTLNEIVLWKVNRYALFDKKSIELINTIDSNITQIDIAQTSSILRKLLNTNGVQLAMASTILRFKNPKIYQIIDQRVFRIIYEGKELKFSSYKSMSNTNSQIEIYIKYLEDLRMACNKLTIPFEESDRILFMADRRINKNHKLKNY